jgi:hypothetical protein
MEIIRMSYSKQLPETLWMSDVLHLWPQLVAALRDELVAKGRLAEAAGPNIRERDIQQGTTAEVSLKHFVYRFQSSAARLEYVLLDPSGIFRKTSLQLSISLSDGVVALLDVPCGSGGGLFGLICSLAELRATGHLQCLPLDLCVLAADVCPTARDIHRAMVERLIDPLAKTGIRLRCEYESWDVRNRFSTTELMDRFAALFPDVEDTVILVSAFSEFASQSEENCDRVLEAITDIIKATHKRQPALAWVEPATNKATGLLSKIWNLLTSLVGRHEAILPDGIAREFTIQHPFKADLIPGRAQVLPMERVVTSP